MDAKIEKAAVEQGYQDWLKEQYSTFLWNLIQEEGGNPIGDEQSAEEMLLDRISEGRNAYERMLEILKGRKPKKFLKPRIRRTQLQIAQDNEKAENERLLQHRDSIALAEYDEFLKEQSRNSNKNKGLTLTVNKKKRSYYKRQPRLQGS